MTKATKKIRRRIKKAKKKQAEADYKEKVNMFSKLDDYCFVCEKVFDRNNKDVVKSWYVVVKKKQDKVNLYCPECWERANSLVKKIKEEVDAKKS
tara:strand:+ start:345 stop:629 length:285 start_codon:yes stop_codon:yes gene_type:complete